MKKVIVGMSGGIDSSVAALLLKQQGYEVIGVSIKHLSDEFSTSKNKTCCSLDDICLLYTSPSPRDISGSRMPSSA